ncbi:MAG: hypothetical protein IKB08_01500 [Clostridia bacterium]|nr:hypothetical protein [Clostridia bacterium]
MKIKILHMFPQLLNLYGEYANLSVITKYLNRNGIEAKIDCFDGGKAQFDEYDMLYMGCGTEENTEHAVKLLTPIKNDIKNAIENNILFLVTGNSLAIFGNKIIKDSEIEGLGIFDFETHQLKNRYTGDIITKPVYGFPAIGFINSSYKIEGINSCWFDIDNGNTLGNDKTSNNEGFIYKNFYATALTGPLLVKNPHITEYFIKKLTDKSITISENDYSKIAYKYTYNKLKNNTVKSV